MKRPCKFFQEGKCKYGLKCNYEHITTTALIDPPKWIFSCFNDLDLIDISFDEVRYRFYEMCYSEEGRVNFQKEWDSAWMANYLKMCESLSKMSEESNVESFTERAVDFREEENLDVFVKPFDFKHCLDEIHRFQMKKTERGEGYSKDYGKKGYGREHENDQRGRMNQGEGYKSDARGYLGNRKYENEQKSRDKGFGDRRGYADNRYDGRDNSDQRGRDQKDRDKGFGDRRGFSDNRYDSSQKDRDKDFSGRRGYSDNRYDKKHIGKYDSDQKNRDKGFTDRGRGYSDNRYDSGKKDHDKGFGDRRGYADGRHDGRYDSDQRGHDKGRGYTEKGYGKGYDSEQRNRDRGYISGSKNYDKDYNRRQEENFREVERNRSFNTGFKGHGSTSNQQMEFEEFNDDTNVNYQSEERYRMYIQPEQPQAPFNTQHFGFSSAEDSNTSYQEEYAFGNIPYKLPKK